MKLKTLIPKSEARRTVIQRRGSINPEELNSKTKIIIDRLAASDDFIYAKRVHTYISTRPGEIDTRKLIDLLNASGKNIVIPKLNKQAKKFQHANFISWDKLIKNSDGYFEPVSAHDDDLSDVDLMIVPAVAVSILGQRVGYGGGYYDKLLRETSAVKVVLAFEYQIFENISMDIHDVSVDKIITELRTINTRTFEKRIAEPL